MDETSRNLPLKPKRIIRNLPRNRRRHRQQENDSSSSSHRDQNRDLVVSGRTSNQDNENENHITTTSTSTIQHEPGAISIRGMGRTGTGSFNEELSIVYSMGGEGASTNNNVIAPNGNINEIIIVAQLAPEAEDLEALQENVQTLQEQLERERLERQQQQTAVVAATPITAEGNTQNATSSRGGKTLSRRLLRLSLLFVVVAIATGVTAKILMDKKDNDLDNVTLGPSTLPGSTIQPSEPVSPDDYDDPGTLPFFVEADRLTINEGAAGDQFGISAAISGDTAIVGAFRDDDGKGSAHLFERDGGGIWRWIDRFAAYDGKPGDQFGQSVAISGDIALVGAPNKDYMTGAVYVYTRQQYSGWTNETVLMDPSPEEFSWFGYSVALAGNTAVVGSPYSDWHAFNSGKAHVFVRIGDASWTRQVMLHQYWIGNLYRHSFRRKVAEELTEEEFGASVAVSQDLFVVGAPGGHRAYVIERDGNIWTQHGAINASTSANDFGISVAVSEEGTIVVGSKKREYGSAFVFRREGVDSSWYEEAELQSSDGNDINDYFGNTVAISEDGKTVIAGAWGLDATGGVYIFGRNDEENKWVELQKLIPSDAVPGDAFGKSVAISENTVVVGDNSKLVDSGTAYIFKNSNG